MATKKPRKRKNSNMKRLTRVSHYCMKGLAIVFTLEQKATFVKISSGAIIPATRDMVTAANEVVHPWRVYTAVMLENSLGEQYMPINECSPPRSCRQESMMDHLNIEHIEQIEKTKKADRVNVGWVAVPSGIELTEKQVGDLLEILPCWGVYERGSVETEGERIKREQYELEQQIKKLEKVA